MNADHCKTEILKLLEGNAKLTAQQIASMLGMEPRAVEEIISELEKDRIILGYQTLVDWDRMEDELVTALIEVKVTPQRGNGFDRIAERIYQFDEVESVYLMSGGYDLTVIISGRTLREVAAFVSARLSIIDGVISTATHFILKKYKEKHCIFPEMPDQEERMLFV
jgi:DNA-binding Lrp family transcriptional regulator